MTCVGHYVMASPVYGKLIDLNTSLCTNGRLENELCIYILSFSM